MEFHSILSTESKEPKPVMSPSTDPIPQESNTMVSTAVSSLETKESISTSIPSEAPPPKTESSDSNAILPLLEQTFETSVSGVVGGDAALEKPYRKNARCSAQNHLAESCAECDMIEKDLQEVKKPENEKQKDEKLITDNEAAQESNGNKIDANQMELVKYQLQPNENVWQVSNIDKYDTMGKFNLSSATTQSSINTSGVDSTSFVILHDENVPHFLPNITATGSEHSTVRNGYYPSKRSGPFNRPCDDCCFCNPNLHQNRYNGVESSPKKCNFCSSRQQSSQTTPNNSMRFPTKNETQPNETSTRSSTAPTERIYESKYRSSHTHVRTHSRESDTINTQCTKKTNRLVRRSVQNGIDDILNGNTKVEKTSPNVELNETKAKKKSSIPKLPPPTQNDWNSMDTSTSPSSSLSTGSSNKSNRRQDSKSVPNLPKAERWQHTEVNGNTKTKARTNSRFQEFYGNDNDGKTTTSIEPKSKPTGKFMDFYACFVFKNKQKSFSIILASSVLLKHSKCVSFLR